MKGTRKPGSESRTTQSLAAEALVFREVQIADATEKPRRAGLEGSHGNVKCVPQSVEFELRFGSWGRERLCTVGWQQQQAW